MEIRINVREGNFNSYVVEAWHKLAENNAQGLYFDLAKVSETCSGITSPDLVKNNRGINALHLEQKQSNYELFKLLNDERTRWSVEICKRCGYMAYIFTIEKGE